MKRFIVVALIVVGAIALGLVGWSNAGPAAAKPGYTCNPAPGHGNPGCHVEVTTTTAAPTTTTTAAPTTTTTAAPITTTTLAPTTTTTLAATTTTTPAATTTTTAATTTTTVPSSTTTTVPGATTTTTQAPVTSGFSDVTAGHIYFKQIKDLAARHVIGGFVDGTFKPERQVNRQQFAKMIVLALGYPVSLADNNPFKDVSGSLDANDPLYPVHYVAVCAARNITQGKRPGEFAPYDNMTRAQLITMVARAANLPKPPASYMAPFGNFSPDHYAWARKAASAGLLNGLAGIGPMYDFFAPATRGEVCVLLYNLLHR